jgi:cell division protease FtsH
MVMSFKDIAGYASEKKELGDIVNSFKHYKEYAQKGIYLPKGLMLTGDPGTGKTLFARVLAAEAGARFYEFKAKTNFLVSGAMKLKECFKKAKKNAPAIIFIDEIDTYLSSENFTSDSSNSFQATLLTCIDGFSASDGIMVVGATSNGDELPPALLRSGRMDIHICIPLPSKKDRVEILAFYLEGIQTPHDVNLDTIAAKCNGFTGADLKTLVNQSCSKALAHGAKKIVTEDFFEPIHNIFFQDIKRSNEPSDREFIAIHEIGHLVVGRSLLGLKGDIDIDSYGESLGSTFFEDHYAGEDTPKEDNDGEEDDEDDDEEGGDEDSSEKRPAIHSCEYYLDLVSAMLGGMAEEEIRYGKSLTGNSSDLNKAIQIIHSLFDTGYFGFSYLNFNLTYFQEVSEASAARMEKKLADVLSERYQKALDLLKEKQPLVEALLKAMEGRTLFTAEESEAVFLSFEDKKAMKDA